ncbi:MAG: hypothetical protein QM725_10065 [Lacibacter sp.]
MANVTYLLGAGASANCLPVIQNFSKRLLISKKILEEDIQARSDLYNINFDTPRKPPIISDLDAAKEIIKELEWVISESATHQTIDTLAKKFFHKDLKSLFRLKRILIFFFLFEQKMAKRINSQIHKDDHENAKSYEENLVSSIKEASDKRYDSFIAAVLKNIPNKIELQNNIKVLSWNYDCQFEIALMNYSNKNFNELKAFFQVLPNTSTFNTNKLNLDLGKFAFLKLNGSAEYDSFAINNGGGQNILETNIDEGTTLNRLIEDYMNSKKYENSQNSHLTYFNYSWEQVGEFVNKYEGYNECIKNAFTIAEETEILVVIGYSFPFFNRKIDRKIMNSNRIQKVYVQDVNPQERIFTIKESFESLRGKQIIPINFINSFFLPPEL